jgi:hypothetical protein
VVSIRAEPAGDGWVCSVKVRDRGQETEHRVRVHPEDLERWGRGPGRQDVEDLVRRSFAFLLEREPPGSILREFDLATIRRYFPEYDDDFRR